MSADDRSQADRSELLTRLAAAEARAEAAEARAEAAEAKWKAAERRHGRSADPDEFLRRAEEEAKEARGEIAAEEARVEWCKDDPPTSDLPRMAFSSVEAWLDAVDPLDPADKPELERHVAAIVKGAREAAERRAARDRAIWRPGRIRAMRGPMPAKVKRRLARFYAKQDEGMLPVPALVEVKFWTMVAENNPHNPLFAWQALRLALEAGCLLPESVARYLHGVATKLFEKGPEPKTSTGQSVIKAFGFASGGGHSLFRQFDRWKEILELWEEGERVRYFIDHGQCPYCEGKGEDGGQSCSPCRGIGTLDHRRRGEGANRIVAEKRGVGVDAVKSAYTAINKIMKKII